MTSMSSDCTTSRQVTPVFEILETQTANSWVPIKSVSIIDDGEQFVGKIVLAPIVNRADQLAKLKISMSSEQSGERNLSSNRGLENRYQIGGGLSADIQQDSERSSEATVFGKNTFRKSSKNYKISTTFSKKKVEQTNNPLQKISSAVDKVFKRS